MKNRSELENFDIDKYSLDEEWVRQVKQVAYFGEKLARARQKLEEAKRKTQIFEADTATNIRRKPGRYGVKRVTEAAIKEIVALETLKSTEHEEYLKIKHEYDLLEITMRTLEHKKRALTDLVTLHGQQYFSEPTVPKGKKLKSQIERHKDRLIRGIDDESQE